MWFQLVYAKRNSIVSLQGGFWRLFFFGIISSTDREVSHLVRVLGGGNNSKVISQLLLLQVPLGKVLELTLGESQFGRRGNSQLGAVTRNDNTVGSEGSSLSTNLDAVVKVLFELSNIQDLIVNRLCAVNDELDNALLSLSLKIIQ